MTLKQGLIGQLIDNGLWADEAEQVFNLVAEDEALKKMQIHWNDEDSEYPRQLLAALMLTARKKAVEWIDANQPKHFARAMFTGEG